MQNRDNKCTETTVFGIVFFCVLFLVSCSTLVAFAPKCKNILQNANGSDSATTIKTIEQSFNDSMYRQKDWITLYGASQRLLMKYEINNFEVIKDLDGFLHVPASRKEKEILSAYADNLQYFYHLCQAKGIPFLFVTAPSGVILEKTILPEGIVDYSNDNVDAFLEMLSEREIPFLDGRLLTEDLPLEDIFYKTDHHWALPITFRTFSEIVTYLNDQYGMMLDQGYVYRNLDNYTEHTYPNSFLGSSGIKVGEWYTGKDLFRVYEPTFETNLINRYYEYSELRWIKEGTFWNAMIQEELILDGSYYNKYNVFLNGSANENRITNNLSDNDKRLMLVSGSFGRQLIPYMSLCFSETAWLDPQPGRYTDSYTDYIEEFQPDCVVILFNGRACYVDIPI